MKNRNKVLVAFLLVLATSLFSLFAGADWENVFLSQPTNVINNQSVMVELSQAKTINFSSAFGSTSYTEPYKSSYEDQGNIVLFTLIDTLNSSDQSANITLTIESENPNGFFFAKDGNETNTVEYELETCLLEFEKGRWDSYSRASTSGKMTINAEKTVGESKITSFKKNGLNKYVLSAPTTSYTSLAGLGWLGEYPKFIRYYYVCIKILGGQNLEEGTYTTAFTISSSNLDDSPQRYVVKGYVGEKPIVDSTDFSFFIDPSTDSYFTDLVVAKNTNSPTKDVASLHFYYTRRKQYSNNSTPNANNLKKKFTIYISPTNDYTENVRFVFKKTGTENQADSFANRIYYEIDTTNTTGLTKYNNNSGNYAYYFYPDYTNQVISSSTNNKNYQEFWKLEGKHIYIKVSNDSKEDIDNNQMHSVGTYSSTIYFTIVPNDSL